MSREERVSLDHPSNDDDSETVREWWCQLSASVSHFFQRVTGDPEPSDDESRTLLENVHSIFFSKRVELQAMHPVAYAFCDHLATRYAARCPRTKAYRDAVLDGGIFTARRKPDIVLLLCDLHQFRRGRFASDFERQSEDATFRELANLVAVTRRTEAAVAQVRLASRRVSLYKIRTRVPLSPAARSMLSLPDTSVPEIQFRWRFGRRDDFNKITLTDTGACCARCGNVDERLKKMHCARCRLVSYCGVECQRAHWRTHHALCAPTRFET
eukprot:gene10755-12725_t